MASDHGLIPNQDDYSNVGYTEGDGPLQRHIAITGGYKFAVSRYFDLVPSAMVKMASPSPVAVDVNLKAMYAHGQHLINSGYRVHPSIRGIESAIHTFRHCPLEMENRCTSQSDGVMPKEHGKESSPFDKLPDEHKRIYSVDAIKEDIICDYIAGMSDRFVINLFKDIFIPKTWKKY